MSYFLFLNFLESRCETDGSKLFKKKFRFCTTDPNLSFIELHRFLGGIENLSTNNSTFLCQFFSVLSDIVLLLYVW